MLRYQPYCVYYQSTFVLVPRSLVSPLPAGRPSGLSVDNDIDIVSSVERDVNSLSLVVVSEVVVTAVVSREPV